MVSSPDYILLRAAFEAVRSGICVVDTDGLFVLVNPAFCALTTYSVQNLITQPGTLAAPAEIANWGIGIPRKDHGRMFEAFHCAADVDNISGTSPGLAIVKKSIDLHGGSISLESEVGHGTRFAITPPLRKH